MSSQSAIEILALLVRHKAIVTVERKLNNREGYMMPSIYAITQGEVRELELNFEEDLVAYQTLLAKKKYFDRNLAGQQVSGSLPAILNRESPCGEVAKKVIEDLKDVKKLRNVHRWMCQMHDWAEKVERGKIVYSDWDFSNYISE